MELGNGAFNIDIVEIRARLKRLSDKHDGNGPTEPTDAEVLNMYARQQIQRVRVLQSLYMKTAAGEDMSHLVKAGPRFVADAVEKRCSNPNTDNNDSDEVGGSPDAQTMELLFTSPKATPNWLPLFSLTRGRIYREQARRLTQTPDVNSLYQLMTWCNQRSIFLNPTIRIDRDPTAYRDYRMIVQRRVPKYCPLMAIPEHLCIGFKNMEDAQNNLPENDLHDEKRAKEFAEATGAAGDLDICRFFFDSLGMVVSDLLTAIHSPVTDKRHLFCESLRKVRTLLNAPYFEDNVRFGTEDTALGDVLLQMIRNYIAGGPLVGKVDRDILQWAVSLCMSHATPLAMGSTKSIGIVPLVHLLPHGGENSNCIVIARSTRRNAGRHMMNYFKYEFGLDFDVFEPTKETEEPRWVYLVPIRDLNPGEEILAQVMAPVCDSEKDAEHMWRLSCGTAPPSSMPSAKVMALQTEIVKDIIAKGKVHVEQQAQLQSEQV